MVASAAPQIHDELEDIDDAPTVRVFVTPNHAPTAFACRDDAPLTRIGAEDDDDDPTVIGWAPEHSEDDTDAPTECGSGRTATWGRSPSARVYLLSPTCIEY